MTDSHWPLLLQNPDLRRNLVNDIGMPQRSQKPRQLVVPHSGLQAEREQPSQSSCSRQEDMRDGHARQTFSTAENTTNRL